MDSLRETAPSPGIAKRPGCDPRWNPTPNPGDRRPSASRGAPRVWDPAGELSPTQTIRRSVTMRVGLLGRKVGMTQIFQPDGTSVPVTVLECGPCTVLLVRTMERDGYHAVQLGFA